MPVLLGVLILAVAELAVLVGVAREIGVLPAIVALIAISALGPWLVRRAGFAVWRRARQRLDVGEVPAQQVLDGAVLLASGVLLCVPGFITDVVGLVLLLPPVRAAVGRLVAARLARRAGSMVTGVTQVPHRRRGRPTVVDAGSHPARAGRGAGAGSSADDAGARPRSLDRSGPEPEEDGR